MLKPSCDTVGSGVSGVAVDAGVTDVGVAGARVTGVDGAKGVTGVVGRTGVGTGAGVEGRSGAGEEATSGCVLFGALNSGDWAAAAEGLGVEAGAC
jgi:hypothetical protein